MKIVSACLAGVNCKWNGKNELNRRIKEMVEKGEAIAACPEVLGGLSVPRAPCGIHGGLGEDVLSGKASVRKVNEGKHLTELFTKGAEEFLKIAKSNNAEVAIMRTPSPSCGCGKTWQLDNDLVNHVVEGMGSPLHC